ncbi:DASS family sodium-coupled anion symporter [Campylobacter hyointestinalis]|uniref:DASS family sodium-coupled anion symporter n=2 Tax=Campylobacter hyointestinalis TaxID=198 RepID=A0AAV6EG20_CAMHY|nr:DASS family sodium-coupled anion symporter [Campylobacter hyointestinalis]ANE33541.1 Na+/sulfate symporter family protein [Campylobacter hyointestinalis subsp. lawsonii CCUG 27631]KAB0613564.1 DASS family sodium-coupled anion symporter [Campylobacter hyointestinalis subsp. lawsonii]QKF68763.1 sodium:sulfate symporter family protein [Campylobacter hyointestinalis subsp. lawsonii]RAZ27886.1 anion permease [Campylobacter hyointestinalis subsp. lawsonii]RAZ46237.1 anion permease [Campylobacter 
MQKSFYIKLLAPFLLGIFVFLSPRIWGVEAPDGLSINAWLYFSIFVSLTLGLILEPVSPALISLVAVTIAVVFKVGPVKSGDINANISSAASINWGLSGFSNSVVWLIFAAFTIGLGFSKTGLGKRLALYIVSKLGRSTLGLGYAIAIVDGILAPFIPSNAARSGGTVYPIVNSIAPMFDSSPQNNPRKIGAYLVWIGVSASCVTSSLFLTGQAPNPLALSIISKNGIGVVDWLGWFIAIAPIGIFLFILTPLITYFIYPPEVKGSKDIANWAKNEYENLGAITKAEIYMICIAIIGLILWVGSSFFKINATTTALIMLVLMTAAKTITWNDFLSNKQAWNTFVWFGTLVTMAAGLKNVGFLDYLAKNLGSNLVNIEPNFALILLVIFFSLLRYFFASGTAYVTATVAIFVTIANAIPGLDPALTMLVLCLPMGFMGILTPYGTGCSPLWFGSHFILGPKFFALGAIFGAIYLLIFIVLGIPWVKFIFSTLNLG